MRKALTVLALFGTIALCFGQPILDTNDQLALSSLSDYWTNLQSGPNPWNDSTIENACTEWRGILCDSFDGNITLRVTELNLRDEELLKALPNWLAGLTALQRLDLANTRSTGALFPVWTNLTELTHLVLSNNSLTGAIPEGIKAAVSLTHLELDRNRLGDKVPQGLRDLRQLEVLNVTQNNLSGLLTSWFEFWPHLRVFSASNNRLWTWNAVYSLAPTVGLCTNLTILEFGGSQAQLPFPPELGDLENLEEITFEYAQLQAWPNVTSLAHLKRFVGGFAGQTPSTVIDFPNFVGGMVGLETLVVQYGVSGTIPDSIGELTGLRHLDLSNLRLNGSLPESVGALTNLEYFDISGNPELTGSLPDAFNEMTQLRVLRADHCQLTGLPSSVNQLSNLEYLSLSYNDLSTLPQDMGSLTSLKSLSIKNNRFQGPLPADIGLLVNLEQLSIGYNQFTELIDFSNLTQLWRLEANNLSISGPFPTSICVLTSLTHLSLASNELYGELPDDIFANLTEMRSIVLAYNQISGPLPSSLTALSNLRVLDVSNNLITSPLPDISQIPLYSLNLHNNDLDGPLPEWLGSLTSMIDVVRLSHNRFNGTIPEVIGETSHPYLQLDLSYNELEGGLPLSFNQSSTVRSIWLSNNRMHFCPTNNSALPEYLFCDLQNQNYSQYDCGCEVEIFTQCWTTPSRLHQCVPCASPPPSDTKPWHCREGYWFYNAIDDENPESNVVLYESSAVVLGDFIVPSLQFNGLRAQLNVSRCLNVSEITISLSEEDIDILRQNGGVLPLPLVNIGTQFLFNSSHCRIDHIPTTINQPTNPCFTLTTSGFSVGGTFNAGFALIDIGNCGKPKAVPWWGILLAVVLAIAAVVGTIAILATRVPAVKHFFRPFHKPGAKPPDHI
jgi:Leucine-rich repeat (LRR) protein